MVTVLTTQGNPDTQHRPLYVVDKRKLEDAVADAILPGASYLPEDVQTSTLRTYVALVRKSESLMPQTTPEKRHKMRLDTSAEHLKKTVELYGDVTRLERELDELWQDIGRALTGEIVLSDPSRRWDDASLEAELSRHIQSGTYWQLFKDKVMHEQGLPEALQHIYKVTGIQSIEELPVVGDQILEFLAAATPNERFTYERPVSFTEAHPILTAAGGVTGVGLAMALLAAGGASLLIDSPSGGNPSPSPSPTDGPYTPPSHSSGICGDDSRFDDCVSSRETKQREAGPSEENGAGVPQPVPAKTGPSIEEQMDAIPDPDGDGLAGDGSEEKRYEFVPESPEELARMTEKLNERGIYGYVENGTLYVPIEKEFGLDPLRHRTLPDGRSDLFRAVMHMEGNPHYPLDQPVQRYVLIYNEFREGQETANGGSSDAHNLRELLIQQGVPEDRIIVRIGEQATEEQLREDAKMTGEVNGLVERYFFAMVHGWRFPPSMEGMEPGLGLSTGDPGAGEYDTEYVPYRVIGEIFGSTTPKGGVNAAIFYVFSSYANAGAVVDGFKGVNPQAGIVVLTDTDNKHTGNLPGGMRYLSSLLGSGHRDLGSRAGCLDVKQDEALHPNWFVSLAEMAGISEKVEGGRGGGIHGDPAHFERYLVGNPVVRDCVDLP